VTELQFTRLPTFIMQIHLAQLFLSDVAANQGFQRAQASDVCSCGLVEPAAAAAAAGCRLDPVRGWLSKQLAEEIDGVATKVSW
jgi:hypothetical protein